MTERGFRATGTKPYKGLESFQVEDAALFFGRDREADQIIAQILSSRMTLLHAQSGAGKTSLLNARIISHLESRGWTPVRVLLHDDPVASTWQATLQYVLPPPETEVYALQRMIRALATADENLSLDQFLERYEELPVRDPRKRALIAPVSLAEVNVHKPQLGTGKVVPYVCRLLRSSIELHQLAEHIESIGEGVDLIQHEPLTGEIRISDFLALLADPALHDAYQSLLAYLDIPVSELWAFLENLIQIYGLRRSQFALVLIFDQFEELFTRFVDPGPITVEHTQNIPDWRLRWEFFDELKTLYERKFTPETGAGPEESAAAESLLPIRYVISMRSEYIAQLDPIRQFVRDLDQCAYHLDLLGRNAARSAIQEPARFFGYSYADDCYARIAADLTKEERYVEPTHLQIVAEKLWNERGCALSEQDNRVDSSTTLPQIELDTYQNLKGTAGILRAFLRDFLDGLDRESCLETLEMLEPLITTSGTRNIVDREQLANPPFRNASQRKRLLANLVDRTIVRIEGRLGGYFIEITHEFLIGPVLEAIREVLYRDLEYNGFRLALRALERFRYIDFRADVSLVPILQDFLVLHENRHRIEWNDWAIELMLRAAIRNSASGDVIRFWAQRLKEGGEIPDARTVLEQFEVSDQARQLLTIDELRVINEQRTSLEPTPSQLEAILRSELLKATDSERDNIRYWTRRALR